MSEATAQELITHLELFRQPGFLHRHLFFCWRPEIYLLCTASSPIICGIFTQIQHC